MTEAEHKADDAFVEATARNVANFIKPYVRDIGDHYKWDFEIADAKAVLSYDFQSERNWYEKTVKLKDLLIAAIQKCDNYDSSFKYGRS